MIKLLGIARIEQLLLLFTFTLLFVDDLLKKEIRYEILFFFITISAAMVLVSMNSSYEKIDENGYYIKFLLIYPAAFYVGARILAKVNIKDIIYIFDFALLFYVVSWLIIMYAPLPDSLLHKVVHFREFGWGEEFLPLQGTFYEAGAIGIIVGSALLFAVLMRYEFNIWPKDRRYLYLLYFLVLYMFLMSRNKTIWLTYTLILLFLAFYKGYLLLSRSNYFYTDSLLNEDNVLRKFSKVNSGYLLFGAFLLIIIFFAYNTFSPTPFITMEEMQFKMEHERGAQFAVAWDLIEQSNYFGGYGYGFVEVYFEGLDILGVGAGSGSINNTVLNMWLQGSIIAVVYLSVLFYLGFNKRLFLTISTPLFFFFSGLTNPVTAEEFHLFLGLAYSFSSFVDDDKVYQKILNGGYS